MSVLVDTNILCRIADPHHPQNAAAAESVKRLLSTGETLLVVPQNIYEFWVVATRPIENNGLGMSTSDAKTKLDELLIVLEMLPEIPAIFPEWQRLVAELDCKGKPAHDAHLFAAMIVHDVKEILTFNIRDFIRYPGIVILDPREVASKS